MDGSGSYMDEAATSLGAWMDHSVFLSTVTDHETAHTVETVAFSDLTVEADGIFARSQSGSCIEGRFYGPCHAEAAGIFEQSDIVGAFGAKRQ